ncbi:helix-turn-helix domain-containing protein [Qipengyuania sp. YG27]|uniref:Helix-turn-helix domain-containing protein n=1 Tax=Qipengyuania mesophila TaxID=2867246 RepID=A0ABS7JW40_9SPHN|nr:helix-turn-helix domain-containing protein [Qipengyuania mesophila]MBX7501880.1 helix-turn-helix domain-containing protein [Qipengyuania mesophila]
MSAGAILGQIAETSEPRRGEPRLSLNVLAGVRQGSVQGNARILNISRTGMLLETSFSFHELEPITVVIPDVDLRRAKVVWSSGQFVGCHFEKPLRRVDLVNSALRSDGPNARELEPIGPRIKRLRQEAGLSMVGLARAIGVSKPTIWKWETGKILPSQHHFRGLCGALRVAEVELAYGAAAGMASPLEGSSGDSKPSLAEAIARGRKSIAEAAGIEEHLIEISIASVQLAS